MARLTQAEKKILRYPPTKQTWRCKGYVLTSTSEGTVEKKLCGTLVIGMSGKCFVCGKKKPSRPELVWPEYVRACQKAGIEPGTKWRETEQSTQPTPKRRVRRKAAQ